MQKPLLLSVLIFFSYSLHAQYTETINSNRPGESQGAFAVGNGVIEGEAGVHYGQSDHDLTGLKTKDYGINYEFRYGLLVEQLELNLKGDFVFSDQEFEQGGVVENQSVSNFRVNRIGAKYLLYDPYKKHQFDEPNLYSWKANNSFKWWTMIPAVSVYAGANLDFGSRADGYPFYGERSGSISPRAEVITQHNWGRFVFVMNFIADRLTEDYKRYAGIFTLTHSFNGRFSMFTELKTIKDEYYSDDLLRFGGAYLFSEDFQVDLGATVNFKNTPSVWQVGVGVSYRIDLHDEDEEVENPNKKKNQDSRKTKGPKDAGTSETE